MPFACFGKNKSLVKRPWQVSKKVVAVSFAFSPHFVFKCNCLFAVSDSTQSVL